MNSKTRIGMAIAGIAAVVTMGISAPAFAGQTDHNSDYARQHRNDSQAIRRQKQRKWQMAHNHNGHQSDWNSNSNRRNGNSYGTTYGSSHGSSNHNGSGSHSGRNGSGAGSGYSHSGQSNQNLGQSGHNRGQNGTNNQNSGNRGQQTQGGQRTHSHDTSGNGG
jgi:hypothetical protein